MSKAFESAGFSDGFRAVHPDPTSLGNTWTAGRPYPFRPENETFDRIDFTWLANLRAIDSVVMGEPGNQQNALSVMPWPSDHRAVLTTVEVTPIDTPDLITVEPHRCGTATAF